METETAEIIELKDCYEFLRDNLDKDEISDISKLCDCTFLTVKGYINGNFPDNSLFKNVAPKIVTHGFNIILKKAKELNDDSILITNEMKKILNGKSLPNI